MEDPNRQSILEIVGDIAEFANSVAALLVGHRKILVEGGFDNNMADIMCAGLHAKLLGLVHEWEPEIIEDYELESEEDD